MSDLFDAFKSGFKYEEPEVDEVPQKLAHEKVPVKEGGIFESSKIPDQVFEGIAQKYGVEDVQKLRDYADLHGALREYGLDEIDSANALKSKTFWKSVALDVAGVAGEGMINIPAWVWKKAQKENYQQAFDEVKQAAQDSRSWLRAAEGALFPGLGVASASAKLGKAAGAGLGAVGGLTGSRTGEELEGLASGAAMGQAFSWITPENMRKFREMPVFRKINTKFNKPDTVVDTLEGFKSIRDKLLAQERQLGELEKVDGFIVSPGKSLTPQQNTLLSDYASYRRQLFSKAIDLARKTNGIEDGTYVRPELLTEATRSILEDTSNPITRNMERIKAELEDVGGFVSPIFLTDTLEMRNKIRKYTANLGSIKAKAAKQKILEGNELSSLADFLLSRIINSKEFLGEGAMSGFSVGNKYTVAISGGEPTKRHEFVHRAVYEVATIVADRLEKPGKTSKSELVGDTVRYIYDKLSSFFKPKTKQRLSDYLTEVKKYEPTKVNEEVPAWIQNLLNDKKELKDYRDWVIKTSTDKEGTKSGVDTFFTDWNEMKRASKEMTKWSENISTSRLIGEMASATKKYTKSPDLEIAASKAKVDAKREAAD